MKTKYIRRYAIGVFIFVVSLAINCCTKADDEPLVVYAAAGTAAAMKEIGTAFSAATGVPVAFNFANAGVLARQICHEDKAHVFFSANEKWMDYAEQDGKIDSASRQILLQDVMVVVVPKGRELAVDLTKPHRGQDFAGWFAVGDQTTPLGIYAKQALTRLDWWDTLQAHMVEANTVISVLNYVALGEADAGVVFGSVASCYADKVDVVAEVPTQLHKPIRFPVAACNNPHAYAADFIRFLKSEVARSSFSKYGWTLYQAVEK